MTRLLSAIRRWLEYRAALWQADRMLRSARKARRIRAYRKGWSR